MFRSSTIIRELALNLAKVIFTLKHSVKLRRYSLCGCVAACCHSNLSVPSSRARPSKSAWPLKMEPKVCLETSVHNYQFTLRKVRG